MRLAFERYIGIDYSGAETPRSSLKGLRVFEADWHSAAQEVPPPPSPRKYWTRRGVAEWLVEELSEGPPTLVGIDHGFSFPLQYFEQHHLPLDWPSFLDDFQRHWPTDMIHDDVRTCDVCGMAIPAGSKYSAEKIPKAGLALVLEANELAESAFTYEFDSEGNVRLDICLDCKMHMGGTDGVRN